MPFHLKTFLQSIGRKVSPIKSENINIVAEEIVVEEPKQEIVIPVYDPALDDDYDILPPIKRKSKNQDISRKVSLNPLSDE
jgi:hypothetical protein